MHKIKFIISLFEILPWAWEGIATPTWNHLSELRLKSFEIVLLYRKNKNTIEYGMEYNSQLKNICGL